MAIVSDDILTPDSYIEEISEWTDKIYEITEEDYVHGGTAGISNVPHEQLSNRTLFLKNELEQLSEFINSLNNNFVEHKNSNLVDFSSLRAATASLQTSLNVLSEKVDNNQSELQSQCNELSQRLVSLQEAFDSMEYKYAASDHESGDALSVSTQKVYTTEISLVGVDNATPNKLKYNSSVTVDHATVKAQKFQGELDGNAKSANKLNNKINITLYGDVSGSVNTDASEDIKINTFVSPKEDVSEGTYGPGGDLEVSAGESFYVPEFTVSKSGLITRIANREISITLDADILNKTINNEPSDEKILLIGTLNQGTKQKTYSNSAVYEKNGTLYSRFNEVVDVESEQSLNNKTINGYKIKSAAGRDVDESINGEVGSDKLITSNALAQHTHNYAPSTDGKANKVVIHDNTSIEGKLVTNANDGEIGIDNNISVKSGEISAKSLKADDIVASQSLSIPGGKIWIEEVSGKSEIGITPETEMLLAELNEMKRTIASLDTDTIHSAKIYRKQFCVPMQLLSYNGSSYRLADNRNEVLSQNLALALTESDEEHNVDVLTYGIYILPTSEYDGCGCYVGQDGDLMFERPYDEDLVIKKVGFIAGDKLIFRPEDSNIDYVVSIENRTWEYDAQENVMPTNKARAHDALWEKDVYGDFMPCKGDFSNEFWETNDDGLTPVGEGIVVDNATWEQDDDGNVVPMKKNFIWDSIWQLDDKYDLVAAEEDNINEVWESVNTEITTVEK